MPSCNTYHLTWVSLTLGVGYLFTAAPAKHSRCSLPWTRGISSPPPLLTLNVEWLLSALLRLRSHRSLDVGLLLPAAASGLGLGVAPPICHPGPVEVYIVKGERLGQNSKLTDIYDMQRYAGLQR